MLHLGLCLQVETPLSGVLSAMQVGAFVSTDSLADGKSFCSNSNSNSMLQAGAPFWLNLPEELLVSVFNALVRPRDLLACACVCKAWRNGKAKAVLPALDLWCEDLHFLSQLNHVQLAAVRGLRMHFVSTGPGYATASIMLFTFICGCLPMLRRLSLNWGNYKEQADVEVVGCIAWLMPGID